MRRTTLLRMPRHKTESSMNKIDKLSQSGFTQLPDDGFLRIVHIIGDPKRGIPPIIPVSKSTWWAGVAKGRYPKPVRHQGVTLWKIRDIKRLIKEIEMDVPSPKKA